MKRYLVSFLAVIFLAIFPIPSFSQDPVTKFEDQQGEKALTVADMQSAFEKAMKGVAADKEKEEKKTTETLKEKLASATQEWMSTEKKRRESGLNKYVDQRWEILVKFGDPAHYEYYLRDFVYVPGGSDIIKTDSLVTPYKAVIGVTEKLYVERYHTPDASDVSIFFYTFTNVMKVSFEYRDDRFVFTGSEDGDPRLDPGWPKEIRALWEKYGDKFRTATL
jgi:hypothetical protein